MHATHAQQSLAGKNGASKGRPPSGQTTRSSQSSRFAHVVCYGGVRSGDAGVRRCAKTEARRSALMQQRHQQLPLPQAQQAQQAQQASAALQRKGLLPLPLAAAAAAGARRPARQQPLLLLLHEAQLCPRRPLTAAAAAAAARLRHPHPPPLLQICRCPPAPALLPPHQSCRCPPPRPRCRSPCAGGPAACAAARGATKPHPPRPRRPPPHPAASKPDKHEHSEGRTGSTAAPRAK